jgi:hypothetical protein
VDAGLSLREAGAEQRWKALGRNHNNKGSSIVEKSYSTKLCF